MEGQIRRSEAPAAVVPEGRRVGGLLFGAESPACHDHRLVVPEKARGPGADFRDRPPGRCGRWGASSVTGGSGPVGAPVGGQPVGKVSGVLIRFLSSAPDSVSTPLLL